MKTLAELKNLIKNVNTAYIKVSNIWQATNNFKYNQSTALVKDITTNPSIFSSAISYMEFLNLMLETELLQLSTLVDRTRVKNINSILCKIYSYINIKDEKGTVPIKKCLNDLYGLRIITKTKFDYIKVKKLIDEDFPLLKCTHQNKNGYEGIHIYFRLDNQNYQWELQIWHSGDVESNIISHQKHKQHYVDWEWLVSLFDKWTQTNKDKNDKGGKNG